MDDRLRNGQWKRRSEAAASAYPTRESLLNAPVDGSYGDEQTEWTPLTRRAAVRAYTPVPVSRRTGLIAGGVVLASGGLGMIGASVIALTVGLLIGAAVTADRMAPVGVAQADVAPGPSGARADDVRAGAVRGGEPVVAADAAPATTAQAPVAQDAPEAQDAPVAAAAAPSRAQRSETPVAQAPSRSTAPAAPSAPAAASRQAPVAQAPSAPSRAPVVASAPVAPSAPASAPQVPAAPAAPVAAAPVAPPPAAPPVQDDGWFASARQVATGVAADLLGEETPEPIAAFEAAPPPAVDPASDGLDDLLADLDREPGPRGIEPVATAAAYAPEPPAAELVEEVATDDLLADLVDDLPREAEAPVAPVVPVAPVAPAAAPAASGWMASATALVGSLTDGVAAVEPTVAVAAAQPAAPASASWAAPAQPVAAPASAPAASAYPPPAAPAALPVAGTTTAPVAAPAAVAPVAAAPVAPAPPAPPPAPVCVGELCGDASALGYRDSGTEVDLLSGHSDNWAVNVAETNAASQFADFGSDEAGDEMLDDIDALDSMVVEVRTDKPGVQVIIDGKVAGVTPLLVDVSSGYHSVKLVDGDVSQRFELRPESDPDAWCFESKGRSFKIDRCR